MRVIVKDFLDGKISRRGFMTRLSHAGFSALAVSSALQSVAPLAAASSSASQILSESIIPFEGTGGEVLAEQLKAAGVRYVFLGNASGMGSLCDALVDRPEMQIIQAVHENHCVSMADGYSKASGKTSFVMFSHVGTPNASSNMYNAMKDRTPVVIATTNTSPAHAGRDGQEDVEDWLETVEQFTKFRWLVHTPERIPEWTMKAFKMASTAPGGPSHLRFTSMYDRVKTGIFAPNTFNIPMQIRPNPREVEEAAKILLEAQSPLLYVGSEVFASGATGSVVKLAELLGIPVSHKDRTWASSFPTDHPLFVGDYQTPMRHPPKVDAFLNLGAHMPDLARGRFKMDFLRQAKIIHARVETAHLGTAYPVHVAMAANVKETAEDLIESIKSMATRERLAKIAEPRIAATGKFVKSMEQMRQVAAKRKWDQVPLTWERLSYEINERLEEDAYIVPEFGTQTPKCLQWFTFAEGKKTRIGRTSGRALGWGVGAAIGVKLARPNHQVVCLQADGGFLFGQIETLWSMSRYDVPVTVVIFNNRCYNDSRVRMFSHGGRQAQEQKDMLSYLGDPEVDFVKAAEVFGIKGERVRTPEQIEPAMRRALQTTREGRPYLIEALIEQSGSGADLDWHPDYSVAESRERRV